MKSEQHIIEINIIKEVWQFMLSIDTISQRELIEKICEICKISKTKAYFLLQVLSKPIQTNLFLRDGLPTGQYYEPLILPIPSIDRNTRWALVAEWRENVSSTSEIFLKVKRFYSLKRVVM